MRFDLLKKSIIRYDKNKGSLVIRGGSLTVEENLTVTGTQTFTGAPTFAGAVTCQSTLAVTGATTLTGTVGVGGAAAASALLTVTSTTKGFLPPRMTAAQRDAIASPAAGLVVYNTDTNKLNVRVAAAWEAITSA